jgi:hypothetical protein
LFLAPLSAATNRNRLIVFPLLVEESELECNGDVTNMTLVTLLTVIGCTDKDKCCTLDLAGPTDQTKETYFHCQIRDKSGPSAISPGSSLTEEF